MGLTMQQRLLDLLAFSGLQPVEQAWPFRLLVEDMPRVDAEVKPVKKRKGPPVKGKKGKFNVGKGGTHGKIHHAC